MTLLLLGLLLFFGTHALHIVAPGWRAALIARHTALLLIPAMVLLVAADLPGSRIKQRVGHPMVAGVTLWALAHLLANGTVADLLLFGSFLGWSVASFVVSRGRDRRAGTTHPPGKLSRDVATLVVGLALWALFAFWLHGALFGVRPFG